MRMEKFEYEFVKETGVRVIIGKGGMKENTERACKDFGAIHCVFPAGNAVVAATEAVSYTHLDVYKRQVVFHAKSYLRFLQIWMKNIRTYISEK